jgi:hypothetical protein
MASLAQLDLHFLPSRGNLSTSSPSNAATSLPLGLPKLNCSNVVSRTYRLFSIGRALLFARTNRAKNLSARDGSHQCRIVRLARHGKLKKFDLLSRSIVRRIMRKPHHTQTINSGRARWNDAMCCG